MGADAFELAWPEEGVHYRMADIFRLLSDTPSGQKSSHDILVVVGYRLLSV